MTLGLDSRDISRPYVRSLGLGFELQSPGLGLGLEAYGVLVSVLVLKINFSARRAYKIDTDKRMHSRQNTH